MVVGGTKVIQVTNIAPQATKDQMQTLFGFLGKIEDIRLYPTIRDVSCPVQSRICYIKFVDAVTVGVAQHMTNTVFIDRALIVIPVPSGEIPDEYFALEMTRNGTIVPGLHTPEPTLPPNVVNSVVELPTGPAIVTHDPKLEASGLPQYPPLPSNYDSRKIEEVRRTILMLDIDPSVMPEVYFDFFAPAAEVKYMRECTNKANGNTCMLVEFTDQPSIVEVLKLNGTEFNGKPIKIIHSTVAIVKPQAKSNEAAQREIEEAMLRVKEAQNLISATIDPVIGMLSKDKRRRSRSRSRGRRRRTRSRSHSRRSSRRSRSKSRKRRSPSRRRTRSRSRSKQRRTKSRSKSRKRERPGTPKEKRRKSKEAGSSSQLAKETEETPNSPADKFRSRSRDRKRSRSTRKQSPSRKRSPSRERKRSRSRKRSRERKQRSRSRDRKRSRTRERKRSRSRDRKRSRKRSPSRERKRSRSRGRRSRSRVRRRTPSPPRRSSRRRSRTRSREKKREKRDRKERTPSLPKRNYDEEERGYDDKRHHDKESHSKLDNMDISNSP